jgi:hypothetical protein
MAPHQIAKTQNHRVVGTMNEFAFSGKAHRRSLEVDDLGRDLTPASPPIRWRESPDPLDIAPARVHAACT